MPYEPNFGVPVGRSGGGKPYVTFPPPSSGSGQYVAPRNITLEPIELGHFITDGVRSGEKISYNGENHICIIGKSGSGKDTRLLIPNLLRLGDRSIVAVDPKGEMAAVTAPMRAKYGRVVILNPFGVLCDLQGYADYMAGCGFNPLCSLEVSSPDFNKDAGLLAEALIPMTGSEKQPFFPLMARALVSFLIMYECVKASEQGRAPYLFNVRRMLCEESAEAIPPKIIGGEVVKEGTPGKGITAYAQEMLNSPIAGLRNKAGQFTTWSKSIGDVAATARAETEFLDDPQMAYCLAQNDFDFREVKERITSVYLVLPMDAMKRHGKWLRMVLTIALNACQRPRAHHEPRTLFVLNEFFSLGHLDLVETNFTVVRGAGIQFILAMHSIGQLKQLYDKTWETLLGNTDAIATFAPNDIETAEWFSKRSGETGKLKTTVTENWAQNSGNTQNQGLTNTGETSGFGTSGGWSYSRTASHSFEKEPAVTTYDLYNMQAGEMRIIAANRGDTLHVHALPYFKRNRLIAETQMPVNPYDPNARIPRIARRMPDYAAFQRLMLAVPAPVAQPVAPIWGEPPMPKPSSPAGNDYVDNGTWGQSNSDGWFYDPAKGAPNTPEGGDWWPEPTIENGGIQPPPQAEQKPQATAQASPWLNPAAGLNQPPPSPPAQDSRPVINNYFVNSGSGTMNVNFGDGASQGNSAVYQPAADTRKPSSSDVSRKWQDADWQDVPLPAPPEPPKRLLARSAPQSAPRQPQAPDSISGGVKAQHPGYAPDPARTLANQTTRRTEPKAKQPPKYGGDDWAYEG
jgi:type IV secretion system protein VirD4